MTPTRIALVDAVARNLTGDAEQDELVELFGRVLFDRLGENSEG